MIDSPCPCGSTLPYAQCCQLLHQGRSAAPTAEALMRSRYAAYVKGEIDYLVTTTLPAMRTTTLWVNYQSTHQSIRWIGLEVLKVQQGGAQDKVGKVEFRANYVQDGEHASHHELSRFRRHRGAWCYVDGVIDAQ